MDNPIVRDWLLRPGGLAARLKTARVEAGLTGHGLAAKAGWGQAKVSKIENGRQVPTADDVRAWAKACGLKRAEIRELVDLADEGRTVHLRWQQRIDSQAVHQGDYNRLTAESSTVVLFETTVLPGAMQTVEYATAVLTIWDRQLGRERDEEDIAEAARLRYKRAEYLYDPDKTFRIILTQDVVTAWRYLGAEGMAAQLDRVAMLGALTNVELRIILTRDQQPVSVAVCEAFSLYDDLVTSDHWDGEPMSDDPSKLAEYRRVADMLAGAALDAEQSLQFIRQAASRERERVTGIGR